jgi:FkbM family methyltransferase
MRMEAIADMPQTGLTGDVKHADLIYDVGLHCGEDTDFYLRKGFRVVAFEANPELVRRCRERFKEEIRAGLLTLIEGAIVDMSTVGSDRKVRFYRNESGTAWGSASTEWADRNVRQGTPVSLIEVDAVDFAAVMKKHGVPRYMKIDIEGCDRVCLEALKQFQERPDFISIESDKTSHEGIRQEIEMFESLGYDGFQAVEQQDIPDKQVVPKPAREGKYVEQRFEPGSSGLFGEELESSWKSAGQVLRLYRFIRLGYYLLGDDGKMYGWRFPGAWLLRRMVSRVLSTITGARVPGWYDTHAQLSRRPAGDTRD